VIRASSGTVTMLTPSQRRTTKALDPTASSWPTMLDGLHALMLVYDEEGAGAARAWLTRTGNGDNPRFSDLVTAALHAVPRTRDKGEFVRPEARSLEGIRVTLFDDLPAPPEPSVPSDGQGTLFDDRPEETGEAEQDGTGADDDS